MQILFQVRKFNHVVLCNLLPKEWNMEEYVRIFLILFVVLEVEAPPLRGK